MFKQKQSTQSRNVRSHVGFAGEGGSPGAGGFLLALVRRIDSSW